MKYMKKFGAAFDIERPVNRLFYHAIKKYMQKRTQENSKVMWTRKQRFRLYERI